MDDRQVFNLTWQGIDIEITCVIPDYMSSHREIYGYEMHHIEVKSLLPLPITETGYKSIFVTAPDLAGQGGVLKYITSYIEEEAKSSKWKEGQFMSRQFNLF